MRLLVIGCGSIGARRARLLADMGHEIETVDLHNPVRAARYGRLLTLTEAFQRRVLPDAAFICTPADTHLHYARECAARRIPFLVEKPLAMSMAGVAELVQQCASLVTMGACNLRFAYRLPARPRLVKCVSVRPLSKWGGDLATYASNGIILESVVHELDLACHLLGRIGDAYVDAVAGRDAVWAGAFHEHGESRIFADWREGEPDARSLGWSATGNDEPQLTVQNADLSDAMYVQEMQHFLHCVATAEPTCNPLDATAPVLDWALRLRDELDAACPT